MPSRTIRARSLTRNCGIEPTDRHTNNANADMDNSASEPAENFAPFETPPNRPARRGHISALRLLTTQPNRFTAAQGWHHISAFCFERELLAQKRKDSIGANFHEQIAACFDHRTESRGKLHRLPRLLTPILRIGDFGCDRAAMQAADQSAALAPAD